MRNPELVRQLKRLRDLLGKTRAISTIDFEMQSHWARYICVLAAGFIENAFDLIYTEFVQRAASKPVADYTSATISRVQNPKATKFVETARAFKAVWGDELQNFVDQDGRKEAINAIMDNRHRIAHGQDSGITIAQLTAYLDKSVEVLDYIEDQCSR